MSGAAASDASDFCATHVREFARDQYLATLFAPAAQRPDLYALYAFSIEITRIPPVVREPMAGEVRLQWWHEALHGLRNEEAQANPTAAALRAALARHPQIDRARLLTLLDARTADLYADPVEAMPSLERYADETNGAILQAAMAILSPDASTQSIPLSRHAAFVLTVGDIVKHFARDAARGKTYLPQDIAQQHGVNLDGISSREGAATVTNALCALATDARARLKELGEYAAGGARYAPALLPAFAVPLYLDRVESAGFDPYQMVPDVPQWRRQWAMWRAARRFK
ncbi:MAG: phytoene/squalene synthase family protein [Variibacter sp.]